MHALPAVARPIVGVIDLGVVHLATGIFGEAERLVDGEGAHRSSGVVDVCLAEPFESDEARRRDDLLPLAVRVFFVHGNVRGRLVYARDNDQLLSVLGRL